MELSKALLKDSRIPTKFWEMGTDTYLGSKRALNACKHYLSVKGKPPGLMFIGKASSCKTFLATYVLKCLMAQGKIVAYYTTDDLCDAYFARLDTSATTTFRERILAPDFICFDNVNAPVGRGHKIALLRAVRLRSDEGLPYFVCTRFDDETLLSLYGVVSEDDSSGVISEGDLLNFFQQDLIRIKTEADPFEIGAELEKVKRPFVHRMRV